VDDVAVDVVDERIELMIDTTFNTDVFLIAHQNEI